MTIDDLIESETRVLEPGTTGWTIEELDAAAAHWKVRPRFEIVKGVLTNMAPAYFWGGQALQRLLFQIGGSPLVNGDGVSTEVDIRIRRNLMYIADAVWMSPADKQKQLADHGGGRGKRLVVPPTLIIESSSLGHERHDRETKLLDYAAFGIPNFWILDEHRKMLECFVLEDQTYLIDVRGTASETIMPRLFQPLELSLGPLWAD